jgi:outer membrane autotransporter protein
MGQFMNTMTQPVTAGFAACNASAATRQDHSPRGSECQTDNVNVWVTGYGTNRGTEGDPEIGSHRMDSYTWGVALGVDVRLDENTLLGVAAVSNGGTHLQIQDVGTARSDLFQVGGFWHHTAGAAYVTGALAYGGQDFSTDRAVIQPGRADRLQGRFSADAFSGRLESGYRFNSDSGQTGLTPYGATAAVALLLPDWREQASAGAEPLALTYQKKTATDVRTELGLKTDSQFTVQDGLLTLGARAAWVHNFDPLPRVTARYRGERSFTVNGSDIHKEAGLIEASADMNWQNGWSANASVNGEFSGGSHAYGGNVGVRYWW